MSNIFICLYYFALNKTIPSVHVVFPRNSFSTICQLVAVFLENDDFFVINPVKVNGF